MRPSPSAVALPLLLGALGCAQPEGAARGTVLLTGEENHEGVEVLLLGPITQAVQTDAEGLWQVRGLPPGEYAVVASAAHTREERTSTSVRVTAQQTNEAEPLTLTPVGSLSGHAWGEKGPLTATVTAVGAEGALGEADGAFLLGRVPVGRRDVLLSAPGFALTRLEAIEVRRGENTGLGEVWLQPLPVGQTPPTSTLGGTALVPGTNDHSGITVQVEGTAHRARTGADGSFTLTGIPNGVVSLTFRKGEAFARLPQVLCAPGSLGFIVDGAVSELDRTPILLRVGTEVLHGPASVVDSFGEWAVIATDAQVLLLDPDGGLHRVAQEKWVYPGALRHARQPEKSGAYEFLSLNPRDGTYRLNEVNLSTLETTPLAQFEGYGPLTAVVRTGKTVAWIERNTLYLQEVPGAPVRPFFAGAALDLALRGEEFLVLHRDGLAVQGTDGRTREHWPLPRQAYQGGLRLSPDGRWAVVVTTSSYTAGATYLFDGQRLERLAPCTNPSFSPDSRRLWCGWSLYELEAGQWEAYPGLAAYPGPVWLANGAVAFASPPFIRVLRPGQPEITVGGVTWSTLGIHPTSNGHLRVMANHDELTATAQVLDVDLSDGSIRVLADRVRTSPFLATDRGVLVGRPQAVGSDVELTWISSTGRETALGRWLTPEWTSGLSFSPSGRILTARRLVAGRGIESFLFDTETRAFSMLGWGHSADRWIGERRLLQVTLSDTFGSSVSGITRVDLR